MTKKDMQTVVTAVLNAIEGAGGAVSAKADSPTGETRSEKNERLAVRAFKRAGFGEVKREDRRTYKGWLEVGRKVKEGEKSVKAGSLRLFHVNQTSVVEEAAAA